MLNILTVLTRRCHKFHPLRDIIFTQRLSVAHSIISVVRVQPVMDILSSSCMTDK